MSPARKRKAATSEPAESSSTASVVAKKVRTNETVTSTTTTTTTSSDDSSSNSLSSFLRDPIWSKHLKTLFESDLFAKIEKYLNDEWKAGKQIFPPKNLIFEAFNQTPFDQVKVVLLGQDPYHDDGQAHGLSFSVPKSISVLPPSLKNIFKELSTDIPTFKTPTHGCLEKWAKQGVLLLNATLTVQAHSPNSHSKIGWMQFTDQVIKLLSDERQGLVFLLWGGFAHAKEKLIDKTKHTIIKTAHPSPLSFNKFSNCKCFSRVNDALKTHKVSPIDWSIE